MRIAVIGAAGDAGSRIVAEAVARGHEVVAGGPHAERLASLPASSTIIADITEPDALASGLSNCEVVISAVRFVRYAAADLFQLMGSLPQARLLVVGGAGSLTIPSGGYLIDAPSFPEAARAEATAGLALLRAMQAQPDLDWTVLCPSAQFAPGMRTGIYRSGADDLLRDADGKSSISMEDFAIAMLDEVERPMHRRRRFTVGY